MQTPPGRMAAQPARPNRWPRVPTGAVADASCGEAVHVTSAPRSSSCPLAPAPERSSCRPPRHRR
jgi:hypothetical protein